MCVSQEDYIKKFQFIYQQTKEMTDPVRPFVRCGCGKKLWPHQAYKCLYCGEWYCKQCAEEHFGKTVAQYKADKHNHRRMK